MVHRKEINGKAAEHKLKDTQIEKDYVLSWILYGIASNDVLSKALAFKGGTVLKKVYFPGYRFSEDLDFTLLEESISNDRLLQEFVKVFAFIKEEANITLQTKAKNEHESGSLAFYIDYIGPLQGNLGLRDVKIDITRKEIMEFGIEKRKMVIDYSDLPQDSFELQCYSLPEVLIEKMAALIGRTEPRDLFDFWHLTEGEDLDPKHYRHQFEKKAKNKNYKPETLEERVLGKEKNFKKAWEAKLENQIHELPKFDDVFRESKRYLKLD